MSAAASERQQARARSASASGPAVALIGLTALLCARLLPDIAGKPLHEDEAVAGLISARPLGDLLHTVVLDRGGAPLHFLLAHVALAIHTTPESVRWLSLVFALATVPLCYDLTRRLDGEFAGLVAAALAATSQLLLVYGTFGRMYSLLAFASALAADLFVRAVERPQRRAVLAAAAAALLPLAVHPFGAFLFAAEAAVALWLWRGRTPRAALPVLAVALLALPLLLVDLRLSERYAPEAGRNLDSGTSAEAATLHALGGAAGGRGVAFVVFLLLAAAGIFALARRRPVVAAFAVLTLAVPPCALAVASATGLASDRLGPRHLIFMLPVWIALVAAGANQV
ncbi:MAG: glycosyltransferase family 39 protein, partial [Actinomycetota bacterium]|nr:glycosyltransferase family 39 protein [Actinomycetota bacterium]